MKPVLPILPLLSLLGCQETPPIGPVRETWRSGRDALCLVRTGESLRAGLITYGSGDTNCSARGTATETAGELVITPRGDDQCRIEIRFDGRIAIVGPRSAGCAYYCGPGADYSGRSLARDDADAPVTDLAGDPLC